MSIEHIRCGDCGTLWWPSNVAAHHCPTCGELMPGALAEAEAELLPRAPRWSHPLVGPGLILLGLAILASAAWLVSWTTA